MKRFHIAIGFWSFINCQIYVNITVLLMNYCSERDSIGCELEIRGKIFTK